MHSQVRRRSVLTDGVPTSYKSPRRTNWRAAAGRHDSQWHWWRHCTGRGTNVVTAGVWERSDRDLWSLSAAATFCSDACSVRTLALLRRMCGCGVGQRVSTVPLPHPNGRASIQLVHCLCDLDFLLEPYYDIAYFRVGCPTSAISVFVFLFVRDKRLSFIKLHALLPLTRMTTRPSKRFYELFLL